MPDPKRSKVVISEMTTASYIKLSLHSLGVILAFTSLYVLVPVLMMKNDVGGRSTSQNKDWIGEWVTEDQSCNGPRFRIRSRYFAEPGEDLRRVSYNDNSTNKSASFRTKDGAFVTLNSMDWMTLSMASSADNGDRILKRCLNPFKIPSSSR